MAGRERSKRRRVLRWVALVLATPVVLVLLVLAFLHTGPGQRWVTRKIVERAGERLNGTLEIEAVTFAFFGDIQIRGVRIRDESGDEVVKLDTLEVEPDWSELVGGTPAFDRVALSGLALHIERYADGSSNLKKLIKPKPPEPPTPPTKPRDTRVIIRSLEVDDVALTVDRPDGLRIGLERFGLKGSIDAVPSKQTVKLDIPEVRANLRLEQPKDGLSIRLDDIVVGLAVDLSEGAGKITLPPTRARARIEQKGAPLRKADIELKAAELSLGPGELDIALDRLLVGALVLEALEVHGAVADGNLKGEQKVQVVGLKVDHEKLNNLLGKEVLASDVAIETKISGPPQRIVLDTKVSAGHATLDLDGIVDARNPGMPRYELKLAGAQFESGELVASKKVPPIKLDVLELGVSGTGISREDVEADIGLRLGPLGVDRHRIDEVALQARLDGAILQIDPLRVKGVGSTLWLRGTIDLVNKLVDATLTIEGDVGTALERLRQAGLNISTRLPAGALTLREGVVTVAIKGELEGLLEADVKIKNAPMAGGAIAADLHATLRRNVDPAPGEKKVALEGVHGTVELKEIGIQELAALRGKKLAMTGKVSGKVHIDDDGGEPSVRYDLSARAQSTVSDKLEPDKPMLHVKASGKANKHDVSLDLDVTGVHKDKKLEIAKGTVRAPIYVDGKARGLSPQRPLRVKLTVPERSIEELQPYLPIPLPFDGTVSANLDVEGTAAAPQGKLDVDVKVDALEGQSQKVTIDGVVKSENGKIAVDADVNAWLDTKKDPTLSGKGHVELSRSPLVQGPRDMTWKLKVDAKPPPLEELAMFSSKLDGVSGNATAHIDVHGNERDVYGKIDVDLRRVKKNKLGPIDADVGLDIGAEDTNVALDAQLAGIKMVRTRGKVGRSGKGLLTAVRDKTPNKSLADKLGNPTLDVTVDLLEHALNAHARQVPRLKDAPGNVGGRIHVGGDMKTPTADGVIGLRGFRTVSGEKGNALVRIDAGAEHLGARIELGPTPAPVVISASTERDALKKYLAAKKCEKNCPEEDARLPIELHASAERVDIRRLVPEALDKKSAVAKGTIDWKLDGKLLLKPKPAGVDPESKLEGRLALSHAEIAIPGTRRRYHDVWLRLRHDASSVRLEGLSLRESDLQRKNRKLDVKGTLALRDFKPEKVDLRVTADQWLIFGGKLGQPDAPRGTLTTDIKVGGKLDQPIKRIDVTVNKLEVLIPDRFDRAHQPEDAHLGDVVFLDEQNRTPGKLPVPPREPEQEPKEPADPNTGMDVLVRIPRKIRLLQSPLELHAVGSIHVKKRGDETQINGKVKAVGGELSLGGKMHALERGHIVFDKKTPGGRMDLLFARREHNAALREISKASGGEHVKIHMVGPINDRKTTLSGAGSPGTLFDLLSMHNAGRPRYRTEPDLPATNTVQFPQHDNLLLLSYLSVNVPNMLFLDKVSAWADAYDGRSTQTYGRVEHYESEGYAADDKMRVRMIGRPRGAGQSAAEAQVDYMIVDTPQNALGVGVSAGSRLGGGPGITFDWSSDD